MQFVVRDGGGIAHHKTAFAQIVEGKRADLRVLGLVVVDEILKILSLVGADSADRLAHRPVERRIGLGVDLFRGDLGAVVEGRANGAAAVLFGKADIGFGQGGGIDLARHHQLVAVARAGRSAAHPDALTRQETFEQMQGEIMRACIERHADAAVGQLLGRVNRRVRPHHDGRISDDAATADLAAADGRVLNAAVVAPFAGVVHVRLALLNQGAMACEWIGEFGVDRFDAGLVALGPLDRETLLGEQPFVEGHQLGQALKRRGGFKH